MFQCYAMITITLTWTSEVREKEEATTSAQSSCSNLMKFCLWTHVGVRKLLGLHICMIGIEVSPAVLWKEDWNIDLHLSVDVEISFRLTVKMVTIQVYVLMIMVLKILILVESHWDTGKPDCLWIYDIKEINAKKFHSNVEIWIVCAFFFLHHFVWLNPVCLYGIYFCLILVGIFIFMDILLKLIA